MRPFHLKSFGAISALLLLTACGSVGGDLGDILGGGGSTAASNELRGTVDYVDTRDGFILLNNVTSYQTRLADGTTGNSARVYYDSRTPVEFNGRQYSPADLERGDEVSALVTESGGRLMADRLTVIRDVSGSGGTYGGGTYNSNVRGTVRYIDTSRRTIELDRGYSSSTTIIEYDTNTPVMFNGRSYRASDLERGDEISVQARDIGGGRLVADRIDVVRSVSGSSGSGTGTYGSSMSTLRGTVRYVDSGRGTLELEQTSWISGFNSGSTGSMILQYDSRTVVEYQGRQYAVTNLERGDVIEVQVRNAGTSTAYAERIIVIRG
jgi:hypothetical protein